MAAKSAHHARRGGRQFVKGQSGNPKGSSAKSRKLGGVAKLTVEQVGQVASLLLAGDVGELTRLAASPDAPVLQVWMATLVQKSLETGDPSTWKVLTDRLLGKCTERREVSGPDGAPIAVRSETREEKKARIESLRRAREELGDG